MSDESLFLEPGANRMKFRKFRQNKLWRDNAVNLMEQMGSKIHWSRLESDAFSEELKVKLQEEVGEVCAAKTKASLLGELADVLEVITAFCDLHEVTLHDVIQLQEKKLQERGGFKGRKFVTVAEHLEGSFGEKYCLADPEKYPEITETK
jgi:predicted house-cleaning noncanonical NTP pyrophosphatase (MazG superfamily)